MKNNFATVEDHIQQLVDKSSTESEELISKFVQSLKLESLSPKDQVLLLHSSLLKVQEKIDSFENKEYILLSNYQETITKIFYHRLLFFGSNDGPSIHKAIILIKRKISSSGFYLKQKQNCLRSFTTTLFKVKRTWYFMN